MPAQFCSIRNTDCLPRRCALRMPVCCWRMKIAGTTTRVPGGFLTCSTFGRWRLVAAGADCIKILLYYTPFDSFEINDIKHAWVERIGGECTAADVPFFLEFVGYEENGDEKGAAFARKKPEIVTRSMEEFSKPQYGVDVLKVEVPVNVAFVAGSKACKGESVYTRDQAKDHFRTAAAAAKKPFIYLSAGVNNDVFAETLELAAESGVNFSGVLCGRATWKEGIPIYGKRSEE